MNLNDNRDERFWKLYLAIVGNIATKDPGANWFDSCWKALVMANHAEAVFDAGMNDPLAKEITL